VININQNSDLIQSQTTAFPSTKDEIWSRWALGSIVWIFIFLQIWTWLNLLWMITLYISNKFTLK
jgi:hypothetical protein